MVIVSITPLLITPRITGLNVYPMDRWAMADGAKSRTMLSSCVDESIILYLEKTKTTTACYRLFDNS